METRRLILKIAQLIVLINALKPVFSDCPAQPWNLRCNSCCEPGWLACTCPANGETTGYAVPCCRQGRSCPPCVDYPGCDVFSNCLTCYKSEAGSFQPFSSGRKYCSSCNKGWSGGDCKTCGGILREIRGTIEIKKYPDNIECIWTIDVETSSLIELRFERFDLESDQRCVYDKLTIYDGVYTPTAKSQTLCGNEIPDRFISKSHVIVIQFQSDESNTLSGFRATYRSLNACARTPCKHGGACMLTPFSSFVCVCRRGYSGKLCEIVSRCPLATIHPNLNYELDENGLNFGSKITYTCEKGYHQRGAALAVCMFTGRWSHPPPDCVPACKDLAPPLHGHLDGGVALIGSKVIYACNVGYRLVGPRKRTCTKEKTWSGETPVCVFEDGCFDPGTPTYGFRTLSIGNSSSTQDELKELVNEGMFPYFSSIIYDCERRYRPIGGTIRTCLQNGSFSGVPMECVAGDIKISCSPLEPGPGQVITTFFKEQPTEIDIDFTNTHEIGTVAEIRCAPTAERVVHGVVTRVCLKNGTWSPPDKEIRCYHGTKCAPLPRLRGGRTHIHLPPGDSFNQSNLIHGHSDIPVDTTVTFSCLNPSEYVLAGSSIRVCGEDGTWSGTRPYCVKGCEDPGIPPHMVRDAWIGPGSQPRQKDRSQFLLLERLLPYGFLPPDTILQFECANADFFLMGLEQRKCLSNGTWTGENNPTCLPRCGVNPRPILPINVTNAPVAYPWHAIIKKKNQFLGNWQVHCSGAYIGHNLILTTAQCVTFSSTILPFQSNDISVELGKNNERGLTYQYDVTEIILNGDFDPILHDYDIAMLVLRTGVIIPDDKSVWPVCISTDPDLLAPRSRMFFMNETGMASAWTEYHDTKTRNRSRIFKRNVNSLDVAQEQENENVKAGISTFELNGKTVEAYYDVVDGSGDNPFDISGKMLAAEQNITETTMMVASNNGTDKFTTQYKLNKIIESFKVTRILPSKCEGIFGRRMQRSRMVCGYQNNEELSRTLVASAMSKKCFAIIGNPVVVMRNVKHRKKRKKKKKAKRKRNASKRRHKRQTDPSFNPFFVGSKTIDGSRPLTSFQQVSIVRKVVKTLSPDEVPPRVVIVPTEPPEVITTTKGTMPSLRNKKPAHEKRRKKKRKKKRLPNKAWLLEGLTSWTIADNCISNNPFPFYVFVKIKYFTPWLKRKRDEVKLKKLLLPSL